MTENGPVNNFNVFTRCGSATSLLLLTHCRSMLQQIVVDMIYKHKQRHLYSFDYNIVYKDSTLQHNKTNVCMTVVIVNIIN